MRTTRDAPVVSIGLPVFNGERYLTHALESLLAQDLGDLELIVSDNGSTDGTADICEAFAHVDSRVRYSREDENRGAAWNFNQVFTLARGRYFKWAAHDDVHDPSYLRRCIDVLEDDPEAVLCHSLTVDIDESGDIIHHWDTAGFGASTDPVDRFEDVIFNAGPCLHVFGVIRSELLRRTPLIGAYSSSDVPLLAQLALYGRFREVPDPLFMHREHPDRSIRRHPTDLERAAWFDPHRATSPTFPHWRLAREFFHVVKAAPHERRLELYSTVSRWMWVRRGTLRREVIAGRRAAGRAQPHLDDGGVGTATETSRTRSAGSTGLPGTDGIGTSQQDPPPNLVSVVLSVADDVAVVGRQLEALASQDYKGPWEVVAVDNASMDGTDVFLRGWGKRLPSFKIHRMPARGSAAQVRNAGSVATRGDLVLYCDGDGVVPPGWVAAMVEAAALFDIVAGPVSKRPGRWMRSAGRGRENPRTHPHAFLPWGSGANLAIRRKVLDALGGWNDQYVGEGTAVDLCWRAQLAGASLGAAPWEGVFRPRERGYRAAVRRLVSEVRDSAKLYRAFRSHGLSRPLLTLRPGLGYAAALSHPRGTAKGRA